MKALLIAFSMYSRLPVPDFAWEEEDRKKAMCFFPLVGVFVGAGFILVYFLMEGIGAGPLFKGAMLTAVPLLATGGIHMDGFLDTCDARASWGDREKKLQILKDTHTGAFAVIGGGLYLLLYCSGCSELPARGAAAVSAGFILSRALSGLAAAVFPGAREHGMLADFMKDSRRRLVAASMVFFMAASAGLMVLLGGLLGAASLFGAVLSFFYYRRMVFREFGGVTGDLAGYFLQLCELFMVLAAAVCHGILS